MEICSVFAKSTGLESLEMSKENIFLFDYLQHTGAGSRSHCQPQLLQRVGASSTCWQAGIYLHGLLPLAVVRL